MDWAKIKANYGPLALKIAAFLLTAALGALAHYLGVPAPDPVVLVQEKEVVREVAAEAAAPAAATGWVSDPDEVAQVSATLPIKVFGDTPAGQVLDIPPFHYCWKNYEILFGRPPPIKDQGQVGSCVSFGTNTAVERTLAGEIARRMGGPSEWSRFTEEATYGGSRVEIGGGRIRGDGSVGAWAAQFATKFGMVPRKKYDVIDLSTYSESLCRKWGGSGVPPEFEAVAKKFPVKSFVQVKVWEEAKTALAQDYCISVCSNQGFTQTRDANGVARASGSWAHCMCIDGYHTQGGKEWGHIVNSWSKYFKGPNGWGDPQEDGFWAEAVVIDRMLKQGDSWAFSGVTGFPARKPIDWNVNHVVPRPRVDPFALRRPVRPAAAPEVSLSW